MPYIPPNVEDFKTRFPEFSDLDDVTAAALVTEAAAEVGPRWVEKDRIPATLYLAAHLATLHAVKTGRLNETSSEAGSAGDGSSVTGVVGEVKSIKEGDVTTEFFDSVRTSSGGSASGASASSAGQWEDARTYWDEYQKLLRRNFPPVVVV